MWDLCISMMSYHGNNVYCWLLVAQVLCVAYCQNNVSDQELEIARNGKCLNNGLALRPFRRKYIYTHGSVISAIHCQDL